MAEATRLSKGLQQSIRDAIKSGMTPPGIMRDVRQAATSRNKSAAYRQAAQETADDVAYYLRGLGYEFDEP